MTPAPSPTAGRILATILFTDICESTDRALRIGDRRWRALLDRHDAVLHRRVRAHGARLAKSTGDGLVACFPTPAQAVACAVAAVADADALGLTVRAGVHCGEVELRGADVAGVGVHVAARVCDEADGGEVLASSTVRDLLEGGEYEFGAKGEFQLKGFPDRRQLFRVQTRPVTVPEDIPAAAGAITVALVDDHPLWRRAVMTVLESSGNICVVGQASDGDEAVELVRACTPDVVLMDMQMRTVDGTEATRRIADSGLRTKVLIVSSTQEPDAVLGAVRAGASGYLLKDADGPELQDAVHRICSGEVVFPAALGGVVLATLRGEPVEAGMAPRVPPKAVGGLSAREREVLALMAEGLSNQALAERLFVTVKTVETHVSSIFTKLNIHPDEEVHRRVRAVVTYLTSP